MTRIVRTAKAAPARRVLGIDPSLASTGYAYRDGSQLVTGRIATDKMRGPARLAYVARHLSSIVQFLQPDLVVYEDYAKGQKNSMVFDIGELGGVLKTMFWHEQIDLMLVSPSALKRAITGKGNADGTKLINGKKVKDKTKPEMRAALRDTFHMELDQADEADAAALMLVGEMRFGAHTVARAVQNQLLLDTIRTCPIILGRGNASKQQAASKK